MDVDFNSLDFKKDYSVYDFVKDMYYELILNDDNKDLLSLRKRFFDDVDNFEKANIKSYLKKLHHYNGDMNYYRFLAWLFLGHRI